MADLPWSRNEIAGAAALIVLLTLAGVYGVTTGHVAAWVPLGLAVWTAVGFLYRVLAPESLNDS